MTEKDLKKLSRADLLQMLIDQSEELASVQEKLAQTEAALHDKQLKIDKAGSLAEAAMQLNGVFEAAQASCQQYIDNIRLISERQEAMFKEQELLHRDTVLRKEEEIRQKCAAMEAETAEKCDAMVQTAKQEAQAYWDEVSVKLEQYYTEHKGLRELLAILSRKRN